MAKDPERRGELTDHLAELRTRLIRMIIYVAVGTAATWNWFDELSALLLRPATGVLYKHGEKFLYTSFVEPFMVQLQICMIAGLVIVSPLLTIELWGFVSPGLTKEEKRPLRWVIPFSMFLFAGGIALCYAIMPFAFKWFHAYVNTKNAQMMPSLQTTVKFTAAMLVVFGILFELPVFLMMAAKLGIVNSQFLKTNWRYAVVMVATVAAIATPSNDAFSMIMCAVPMVCLYFISIFLVRFVERKPRKE